MSVISLKCPNCGAELIFDPATQKYKCEYCQSLFSQEEADGLQQQGGQDADGVVYHCPSCGAEIVTDQTTAASFCYYCHNPVVLGGRLGGEFLPDKIIPFSVGRTEAKKLFLEYFKKKKFIPKAFFNKNQMDHLSGVYFPYWVYQASIKGSMTAKGTRKRIWVSGGQEFTETRFFEIEREGNIALEDMTENALKKANHVLAEGILPYRMRGAKPFRFGFLSGFLAEKRDIEKSQISQKLKKEAEEYAEKMLRESVGGYQTVTGTQTRYVTQQEKYEYVLLPVWTLTYQGKNNKTYYYSMNGQTKKVCGMLPVDYKKVALTAFLSAITVFLSLLAGGYFLW